MIRELFELHFETLREKLDENADMLYSPDEVARHWKMIGGKEICREALGFFELLLEEVKRTEVKTEQKERTL